MREDTEKEQKRVVKACKRYIETHLLDDITTQDIAGISHYSYRSLRRFFKGIDGYSVPQYIRLRRIHMAARRLREGKRVDDVFEECGFNARSSFAKAFEEYYGITPWQFAKTRGMSLMQEPIIMKRSAFTIVGYLLEVERMNDWENNGAYWIAQNFPDVSEREWNRIGGGAEMIGAWTEINDRYYYIHGPGVRYVQYVPQLLGTLHVQGGLFAVFPVEKPKRTTDSTVTCENVRVTWYYALRQWLPDSDYFLDQTRTAYEYYLDGNNLVCIPITPKIRKQKRKKKQTAKPEDSYP